MKQTFEKKKRKNRVSEIIRRFKINVYVYTMHFIASNTLALKGDAHNVLSLGILPSIFAGPSPLLFACVVDSGEVSIGAFY